MKKCLNPAIATWSSLCERPVMETQTIEKIVIEILEKVKLQGDKALKEYAKKLEGCSLDSLIVSQTEIEEASLYVPKGLKKALKKAKKNIKTFHEGQLIKEDKIKTTKGVTCWRKWVGIDKVGLYIPGGTAPLFSTILMLGIPAKLAGCKEIVICTPPQKDGSINPVLLYTAQLVGIKKIIKAGGAQAVAAMTFGTESVPKVYKIFGPGNQFVTKAKQLVQQQGVAIDMPAGPSEVLIVADKSCEPAFVAADLLSQAEHGEDSQVVLVTNNEETYTKVFKELKQQLQNLPRKETAQKALENSIAVVFNDLKRCFEFSNTYAPEHLIIASTKAESYLDKITNAGSVFLGNYSCESAGDYASGTNHTLPTNGYAKNYSGVSIDSFCKKITVQKITKKGIVNLGPTIELMAAAEGLEAHKNAVSIRLNSLQS